MKPPPFSYARVTSAAEAVALLHELGDDAKVLAGGQSLVPAMNFRLARPAHLVDVNPVAELDFLRLENGTLRIGATTRHRTVEAAHRLGLPWSALTDAAPQVGHYPIRVRGTFGGSVSHADPTAEFPLVALTLGAAMVAQSREGQRSIPAEAFFRGVFSTDLRPDELLVEVRISEPPAGAATAFEEFSERAGDFALASACVGLALLGDSADWVRVGLGGVAAVPVRSREAEQALRRAPLSDEAIDQAADAAAREFAPPSDFHASSAFRRRLVAALVRRALRKVAGRVDA